ncbi:hypothetical protein OC846_003678 [Tilletia horrida]|uniref:PUM-HD domain-containing protein n=1 Tax=Tilletia horrida TaxID=155126 RepID=A0AAN6GUF6_9BASI|nr:hypothetical protein OC846_003678 [Tilletia horrida]KAK0565551.1 hypothetical protein OC861_003713 [Tilletia horrida]
MPTVPSDERSQQQAQQRVYLGRAGLLPHGSLAEPSGSNSDVPSQDFISFGDASNASAVKSIQQDPYTHAGKPFPPFKRIPAAGAGEPELAHLSSRPTAASFAPQSNQPPSASSPQQLSHKKDQSSPSSISPLPHHTLAPPSSSSTSAFVPQGSAFASFLTPRPQAQADTPARSSTLSSSHPTNRPRAGTLPSSLFTEDAFDSSLPAAAHVNDPSNLSHIQREVRPEPLRPRVSESGSRSIQRQVFYPAAGERDPSGQPFGSASATLLSTSAFSPFSSSTPPTAASNPHFDSAGAANPPTSTASAGTSISTRSRAATGLVPSNLTLSVIPDSGNVPSSTVQGRSRGHTTIVTSTSSLSGPGAGSAFTRQPSPLGPGSSTPGASSVHAFGQNRPPSPSSRLIGRAIAATAPSSALHSPSLAGPTTPSANNVSISGSFFGRDGLFGASDTLSAQQYQTPQQIKPRTPGAGAAPRSRARPSTASAATPFLTSLPTSTSNPGAGWGAGSSVTLFGVDIGAPGRAHQATSPSARMSSHMPLQPLHATLLNASESHYAQSGNGSGGATPADPTQTQPPFLSRIGASLRTASSGNGISPTTNSTMGPSLTRGRALTLAHPNPHSQPIHSAYSPLEGLVDRDARSALADTAGSGTRAAEIEHLLRYQQLAQATIAGENADERRDVMPNSVDASTVAYADYGASQGHADATKPAATNRPRAISIGGQGSALNDGHGHLHGNSLDAFANEAHRDASTAFGSQIHGAGGYPNLPGSRVDQEMRNTFSPTDDPAQMLHTYAVQHGYDPVAFVEVAARLGLLPGRTGLPFNASDAWSGGHSAISAGQSGAGAAATASALDAFGQTNLSEQNQRALNLGSYLGGLPSTAQHQASRPALLHSYTTPSGAPGGLSQAQDLLARDDDGFGCTNNTLSQMQLSQGQNAAIAEFLPFGRSNATASPRARAATASSGAGFGLGDGALAMAVASYAALRQSALDRAGNWSSPDGQLAREGAQLVETSGMLASQDHYGQTAPLAPAHRARSGTLAVGTGVGAGLNAPFGPASAGLSRYRTEQEMLRVSAIVKATSRNSTATDTNSSAQNVGEGAGRERYTASVGRTRNTMPRPATADSHGFGRTDFGGTFMTDALGSAIRVTGDTARSLLPPQPDHSARASRSNSNASTFSGNAAGPENAHLGPPGGAANLGNISQSRPRAATTAALTSADRFLASATDTNLTGPGLGAANMNGDSLRNVHVHGSTPSSQQTPTRSLWIGNLDPNVTGQELMKAFAPYGAVESVRLLPEKECGFVNFIDLEDAIRAREDVLVRLGGRLNLVDAPISPSGLPRTGGTGPNGQVRIGYGKVDSAPGVAQPNNPASDNMNGIGASLNDLLGPDGIASENSLPTRALWIGSIPNTTTQARLLTIFQPFGPVESVRVLTHKNCGFINFERVDDAIQARNTLHGRDFLGSDNGAIRIGYAKVPTRNIEEFATLDEASAALEGIPAYPQSTVDALTQLQGANGISGEQQLNSGYIENYRSNLIVNLLQQKQVDQTVEQMAEALQESPEQHQPAPDATATIAQTSVSVRSGSAVAPSNEKGGVTLPPHLQPRASVTDLQLLMEELSVNDPPQQRQTDVEAVSQVRPLATYYTTIPLVAEVCKNRRFDANRLREIRRLMDSPNFSTAEVDNLANEYMKDIVDLAADYIGNTAVQKFFERASESCKFTMLEHLAPHLAMLGIHKNGTWSAQKIIDCCREPKQMELIAQHLRPYVPPLMLDQYGNYVVQCVLPFRCPASDFVFDAIVDRIWEVAQGRFGARSMRACLENSSHVSRRQIKRVASAIILHAVPLSTNSNGALLLTWLLDTSGLPARYRLLAPRFAPHLAQLGTHKLANLTVQRLINQRADPVASRLLLDALFGKPNESQKDTVPNELPQSPKAGKELGTLEEILLDQSHGSQFLAKILSSSTVEASRTDGQLDKPRYVEVIRKLIVKHRLVGIAAHRKLLEEVQMTDALPASTATLQAPLQAHAGPVHQPRPGSASGPQAGAPTGPGFARMGAGRSGVPVLNNLTSITPPTRPVIPAQLLAAANAGDPIALQHLANIGMLPQSPVTPGLSHALPGQHPSNSRGGPNDSAEMQSLMAQMQLQPQLYPPNLPLNGASMGGSNFGAGPGTSQLQPPGMDQFSMSPEQAVGSGVLSPIPPQHLAAQTLNGHGPSNAGGRAPLSGWLQPPQSLNISHGPWDLDTAFSQPPGRDNRGLDQGPFAAGPRY